MEAKDKNKAKGFKLKDLLKNKYALIILAVGVLLILIPNSGGERKKESTDSEIEIPAFTLSREEERLQKQLSKIKGAGRVSVLLSVSGSVQRQLAESGEETLVISASGGEQVVDIYYVNPEYTGAVIVCDGAQSAQVRLEITRAVCAFTGLTSVQVMVIAMA
ncbi:MAG: hypothetical protein GX025_00650 [Clostridiales bacterium]|jgi:stage III sporulation protein AG|nr:hypothetical protein [Clostridiales bacterium]